MTTTQVQPTDATNVKKTLKKKPAASTVAEPAETEVKQKKEKAEPKKEKSKAEPKAKTDTKKAKTDTKKTKTEPKSKKTDAKKEAAEAKVEKEEPAEKKQKKINLKKTPSSVCGLNLSVAKVKNILANLCINKDITEIQNELNEFCNETKESSDATDDTPNDEDEDEDDEDDKEKKKLTKKDRTYTFTIDDLSSKTVDYLKDCQENVMEADGLVYSRKVIKTYDEDKLADYTQQKNQAEKKFDDYQRANFLFSQRKFDLMKFNKSYDPKFYDGMESKFDPKWTKLTDTKLFSYCNTLINKSKVRFNADSKVFVTAFIEYIVKQLVINGTQNCINSNKKIIQLPHALDTISSEFVMFPFIASTNAYKKYFAHKDKKESKKESKKEDDDEDDEDDDEDDASETSEPSSDENPKVTRQTQFRYYVGELFRDVRMELSDADSTVETAELSKFNQTSVSKNLKQFCTDVILELLHMFGSILKTEVMTRSLKTVNYSIIAALVYNCHLVHNIEFKNTIKFIQDKNNIYTISKENSKEAKAAEKAAAAAEKA
jgi:hypothetical protein